MIIDNPKQMVKHLLRLTREKLIVYLKWRSDLKLLEKSEVNGFRHLFIILIIFIGLTAHNVYVLPNYPPQLLRQTAFRCTASHRIASSLDGLLCWAISALCCKLQQHTLYNSTQLQPVIVSLFAHSLAIFVMLLDKCVQRVRPAHDSFVDYLYLNLIVLCICFFLPLLTSPLAIWCTATYEETRDSGHL